MSRSGRQHGQGGQQPDDSSYQDSRPEYSYDNSAAPDPSNQEQSHDTYGHGNQYYGATDQASAYAPSSYAQGQTAMSGYVTQPQGRPAISTDAQGRPAYGNYGLAALAAQSSVSQPAGYVQGQTTTPGYDNWTYGHVDQQSIDFLISSDPQGHPTTSGGQTSSGALTRGYSEAGYATSPHLQQPNETGTQRYEVSSQYSHSESKDKGKGKRQHASTPSTSSTSSHHKRGQPSKRSKGKEAATEAVETEDSPHEGLRAMSLNPGEQQATGEPVPEGPPIPVRQDPNVGETISPFRWGKNPDWTFHPENPASYWTGNSSYGVVFVPCSSTSPPSTPKRGSSPVVNPAIHNRTSLPIGAAGPGVPHGPRPVEPEPDLAGVSLDEL
ncbi:hypothetical protein GE09DRAFT_1219126 [Coniochaeta sp. 2T2.1]|nr:hypothetical protein GE09DRAFT_1219126 [Coniochaeta sp. 2T2.1]